MAVIEAERRLEHGGADNSEASCVSMEEEDDDDDMDVSEEDSHPKCDFYFPSGFKCGLREIKVVDRQLKPKYLLITCPKLEKLYIDWQVREEKSLPLLTALNYTLLSFRRN